MPSKPRTEPTLDELSAYLDHELDDGDQARVAEHVTACADCQARLDDLRQTVNAVRGLPQETPPRRFAIPPTAQRRAFRWAPVGWIGGVAAAMLLVIIGVTQLHFPGGGTALTSSNSGNSNYAVQVPAAAPNKGAAGPNPQQAQRTLDALEAGFSNRTAVADPVNPDRVLVLGSDATNYGPNWTLAIRVALQGDPSPSIDAQAQGLSVVLVRNGAGVKLGNLVGQRAYGGPPVFTGAYAIGNLPLSGPGSYTIVATWTIPDGSGRVLQTGVPITITAG